MKIFLSADIEGTCGIAHWDETEKSHGDHAAFAAQMTREVAAACEGALSAGADEVFVKDAHDSARNIDMNGLPEAVTLFRGWADDPFCMMYGLDRTFDGVICTGYHSAAMWNGNPLAHTMDTGIEFVRINGEIASELMISAMIASYLGVPLLMATGDQMLCDWLKTKMPGIEAVAVSRGAGGGTASPHPAVAARMIREAAARAVKAPKRLYPMPDHFSVEIGYLKHQKARRFAFYPGARESGMRSIAFEHDDFYEVLRFFHFCL